MNAPLSTTSGLRHTVLLFSTSASALAYEILLMRLMSIGQWHHFAYMAISLALLGFGVAGSLLFLFWGRIEKDADKWLIIFAGCLAVSFPLSFSLSRKIGLDPLQLIWHSSEWLKMLSTYLLMSVPFIFAGCIIGTILTGSKDHAPRMYGADLLGAGAGAMAIVPAMYLGAPWNLFPILCGIVMIGASGCCLSLRRRRTGWIILSLSASLTAIIYFVIPPIPRIHETKDLPMTLSLPDAKVETTMFGPLGMVQVATSSMIRHVPGLSLNFGLGNNHEKYSLPEQKALFKDADGLSPIARFKGNLKELEYLDYTTMALPYHVRNPGKVLIIGAGGGSDVLLALKHRTPEILALEANQQVADLLAGQYNVFSGRIFNRPEVILEVKEARQYLHATDIRFDMIQISLLDSYGSSAGGIHSASENYLYTKEAFLLYLSSLTDPGILSMTRWLKLPPRDSLRVISTALDALKEFPGVDTPDEHLIFIRSWKTSTILISRTPFSPREIKAALSFCEGRSFDMAFYHGMEEAVANRYDILTEPFYYQGAKAITGPDQETFMDDYIFDITPTSDDRPYFSFFFKWDKARYLYEKLGKEWLPMVELGFLFIIATLIQALLAGIFLILIPLYCLRWLKGRKKRLLDKYRPSDIAGAVIYFGGIGFAFMFFEMALLPKFTLLLSNPVYAASAVLSAILVFAGCGSLMIRRFKSIGPNLLWVQVAAVILWVGFISVFGDQLFEYSLGWSFGARLTITIILLAGLSFFLGWPFPAGFSATLKKFPDLAPWVWGVNACASVIGAVLGKCLAVTFGFRSLMLAACILYILAALLYKPLFFKKYAVGHS